tara:strand:+ start:35 stop:1042 length:1008 start_codon:yes stop_codon:yes gene_type:complete
MQVLENVSLKPYNTFGLDCKARFFTVAQSTSDLKEIYSDSKFSKLPKLILGGGSNILLCADFEGLVVKIDFKGIEDLGEGLIKVQAGENWHQFVLWSIEHGYNGIENLSLIPGSVGAAPMQNIGAYGVELKDVFIELEAFHIQSEKIHVFSNKACEFGYRESVFKNVHKGKYIITSVSFKLSSTGIVNAKYGAIASTLAESGLNNPTPKQVSAAVISIRKSKLPDPKEIGNSGSFFKNPIVLKSHFNKLVKMYPTIPSYPVSNLEVKIPAAWLIEKAGWKGKTFGSYGVHKNQALVLVNYGGARGKDINKLAKEIQTSVSDVFSIELQIEVNVIL